MLHLEEMASLQQEQNLKSLSVLDGASLKEVPSEWSPLASTKGEESRDVFIAMRAAGKVLSRLNGKRNIKLTDILTSVA